MALGSNTSALKTTLINRSGLTDCGFPDVFWLHNSYYEYPGRRKMGFGMNKLEAGAWVDHLKIGLNDKCATLCINSCLGYIMSFIS